MTKHRYSRLLVCMAALAATIAAGSAAWSIMAPSWNPDAQAEEASGRARTREEIQAELDEIVRDNMMTVSVSPTPQLDGASLRVNVINDESNSFPQRFEVIQDGETLYRSGAIEPGERVEACEVEGAQPGSATIQVQALDAKTLKDHGSPANVNVRVLEKG